MSDAGVGLRLTHRLSGMRSHHRLALAALSGAAAALGQSPFDLVPVGIAGFFATLVLFLAAPTTRAAFVVGWSFGTGYFALALFWIVEPFLIDVERHGWMAPFALVFMSGGLALFWGAAFAAARWLGTSPGRSALAWTVTLSLAELARSYVLTGFPWALIGHVWIPTGAIHWAALIGPVGLTLATLALVAGTWAVLAPRRPAWWLAAPFPFLAFAVLGDLLGAGPPAGPRPEAPVVRLIQPNAPQDEKWDPDRVLSFYRRQIAFTAEPAPRRPDLVIWSETAIPWMLERAGPALGEISFAAGGAPVVVGVQRRDGTRYFNSLVALGPGGEVTHLYDKHHLVPFGEFIPLGGLTEHLGLRSFAARDGFGYSAGPGAAVLDLGALGKVLPLICYEAIFPQDLRAAPERPDWILQITNDAWFGTISGPYQHLAQARLRAVEQGLPLVRVANTGVSAVIDARGQVLVALPLGEAGWADQALPSPLPATLYARTGDWPVAIVIIVALAGLGAAGRRVSH